MKGKATAAIMLTVLALMIPLFSAVPMTSASPGNIKIGIIGPVGWGVGDGMWKGAELAVNKINTAGGVHLSGGATVSMELIDPMADTLRGEPDPTPTTGTAAMQELVDAGAEFAIGLFRTEAAEGAKVVAADNSLITFICGAATDSLIDDGPGGRTDTLRDNYARWKYLFRNTPTNSTVLVRSLSGLVVYGIRGFLARLCTNKLIKLYGTYTWAPHPVYGAGPFKAVKYAVIAEQPVWADGLYAALYNAPTYMYLLGPNAVRVYGARVSATATSIRTELLAAVAAGARLIIHIFSGPVGTTCTNQWITEIPAADRPILVGINVPGQDQPEAWTATSGRAEYEAFLATAGTRTPINTVTGSPSNTADYWDAYLAAYGDAPVYTSYGVYDTIIALNQTIATWAAAKGITSWPPTQAQYDLLIPYIEMGYRHGIAGWFRYTGNPATFFDPVTNPYPYDTENPTRAGTGHDLFVYPKSYGDNSTVPFSVRAMVAQWQGPAKVQPEFPPGTPAAGRLEIVCPVDQSYSRRYRMPKWYYYGNKTGYATNSIPLDGVDINFDGTVNSGDASKIITSFFSTPGAINWNIEADSVVDGAINIFDALAVSATFWALAHIPYPK